MPQVLTYWSMPEEELEFIEYLSKWDVYAYLLDSFPSIAEVKPVPIGELIKNKNIIIFDFGLKQYMSENDIRRRKQVNDTCLYGVSSIQASTVGYNRPRYNLNGKLGQSNLSAYWKYWKGQELAAKNPEFVKWGKKVFAWARKQASEKIILNGYPYPATKRVKEMVDQNKLQVAF
jgi:hypothetical protein